MTTQNPTFEWSELVLALLLLLVLLFSFMSENDAFEGSARSLAPLIDTHPSAPSE